MTTTITLTRTEAERLIDCYCEDEPREDAVDLLTSTALPTVTSGVEVADRIADPVRDSAIYVDQDVLDDLLYGPALRGGHGCTDDATRAALTAEHLEDLAAAERLARTLPEQAPLTPEQEAERDKYDAALWGGPRDPGAKCPLDDA